MKKHEKLVSALLKFWTTLLNKMTSFFKKVLWKSWPWLLSQNIFNSHPLLSAQKRFLSWMKSFKNPDNDTWNFCHKFFLQFWSLKYSKFDLFSTKLNVSFYGLTCNEQRSQYSSIHNRRKRMLKMCFYSFSRSRMCHRLLALSLSTMFLLVKQLLLNTNWEGVRERVQRKKV